MKDEIQSNSEWIENALRSMVFRGELCPGSDHPEGVIAERLGVSPTLLRRAALALEAEGLLSVRPRKGLHIPSVSPRDMREVYDVLTELECLAAENAARLAYDRAALRGLADAVNAMDEALLRDDRDAWAEADHAFHRELVRLGQNRRAEAIFATMEDQVRRAKQITLQARPLPTQSNRDHRDVLGAIAAHDPEQARRIHRRHRVQARDMLLGLLDRYHGRKR
jgi:DNA-binding GntR family transcriptional regulator